MVATAAQDPSWTEVVSAIAAILVPIAVVGIGYVINRQLRAFEDRQWRSQELIGARLRYYREIAEPLNDLMCYFTFLGAWKEMSPPDVVAKKRSLDKTFYTLVPFFDVDSKQRYLRFMELCFEAYGDWGADARLRTSCGGRKAATPESWKSEWDAMFAPDASVAPAVLTEIRDAYNDTIAALVDDIQLTQSRADYVSARAVLNAH